jgi:hypothetical protein
LANPNPEMYSVRDFCIAHAISKALFYRLCKDGKGASDHQARLAHPDKRRRCGRMAGQPGVGRCQIVSQGLIGILISVSETLRRAYG